jgi:hypothetical protein
MSAKTTPRDPWTAAEENAPIGEPLTEEEREKLARAHADIAAGRLHSQEEAEAVVAEMRRKQEGS